MLTRSLKELLYILPNLVKVYILYYYLLRSIGELARYIFKSLKIVAIILLGIILLI